MKRGTSRRDFLKHAGAAGVGFWAAGGLARADSKSPNDRINIASIGVGGKGESDTVQAGHHGNLVALCDIDDTKLEKMADRFPRARKFHDFRKMFDEMGKEIDAVTVSTADHTHAAAAVMAMKLGKHVYCQKPLTHTVYEARAMRETAAKYKVATQMGNQGTAEDGLRHAVEIIRAGAIGPVYEVHVWTNRPIWPQGADAILRVGAAREAALAALHGKGGNGARYGTPPGTVHWDLWLGPAPERPYDPIYHPFAWRGWWDFGTGALGDMACHTANLPYMALKLDAPTSVFAECGDINPETYPMWAKIQFEFPSRGDDLPPVKLTWYEGSQAGKRVLPPRDLTKGLYLSDSGSLLVGSKGMLYSPSDYGATYHLLPEKDFQDYKGPSESLPRNGKGDEGMKAEWVAAIRGGPPAMSNFDYAARLTETILLGNVAMRCGAGKKLQWNADALKFKNCPEADAYIRTEYRSGWSL